MAVLKLKIEKEHVNIPIPNIFFDQYMPKAHPTYTIVYLYGFRLCFGGNAEISSEQIANSLSILESDVIKAWKYWEKEGLIVLHEEGDKTHVAYLEIPPISEPTKKDAKIKILKPKPVYIPEELLIYSKESVEVQNIFKNVEKILGKLLDFNEMSVIFSLYDWLMFSPDLIEYVLKYCKENGHTNIRYIEKTAVDWSTRGINSLEKAMAHTKIYNKDYREIMKAFGVHTREPVALEEEYMQKWLQTYHFTIDMIREACTKTVMQTGKPSFKYADSILTNWFHSNVKSVEDVKKAEEQFYENKKTGSKKIKIKKNKFINFEQRDWDFDNLEQLEKEHLLKSLEG